jgi:hypothetical protein
MILLVLKVITAPLVIVMATLVQRRFGHTVSGLMIGLPLTSLPLLWLVALSHGATFAGSMSGATLTGTIAQVVVIWVYAALASRLSPTLSMVGALAAFVVTAGVTQALQLSALVAAVLAGVGFAIALRSWPRTSSAPVEQGRYRLVLRVVLSAGFTLAVVTLAGRIGPGLSGLIAALPVLSLIMAFVTHQELGADASSRFLKGVTRGSFAYVVSMLVLTELLQSGRMDLAFLLAIATAIVIQLAVQSLGSLPALKQSLRTSISAAKSDVGLRGETSRG